MVTVSPNPIEHIEVGKTDTCEVVVKNTDKNPVKLRFTTPATSPFTVSPSRTFMLVSGLEAHVFVSCTSKMNDIQKSVLTVHMMNANVEVPITGYPKAANLEFAPKVIDLGIVDSESTTIRDFKFTNCGSAVANFRFNWLDPSVSIEPERGIINASDTIVPTLKFHPTVAKEYAFEINASVEGSHVPVLPMTVKVVVVPHAFSLLFNGNPFEVLDFGRAFFGQKKPLKVVLRNNGPCKRKFQFAKPQAKNPALRRNRSFSNVTAKAIVDEPHRTAFRIIPMSGEVEASGSVQLSIVFDPRLEMRIPGSEIQFKDISSVYVNEGGQKIPIELIGLASDLNYSLSSLDFNFGMQKVRTKATKKCVIENKSAKDSITFEFTRPGFFSFRPEKGEVGPGNSVAVTVLFWPKALGDFDLNMPLSICDGLVVRDVKLIGRAVIDESEKPFRRVPLVETDAEAKLALEHPYLRYGLTKDDYTIRKAQRQENDQLLKDAAQHRKAKHEHDVVLAEARLEASQTVSRSKAVYTESDMRDLLKTKIREVMEKDDKHLGLKHCDALEPYEPKMRRVQEPLRVFQGSARRKAIDGDKQTFSRKFKAEPATRNERNDCAKTLSSAQLLLVAASHHSIDFGAIAVNSREVRTFQVTNNLSHFIQVNLEVSADELVASGPERQIIPPNQVAGFDIILTPRTSQEFSSLFTYTVNGSRLLSIPVVAVVSPIDVQICPEVLEFELQPGSLVNFVPSKVELVNMSNARAVYHWRGLESVFSVHNKSGFIEPMKTITVEVFYRPDSNPHVESYATLMVDGGTAKTLKLSGYAGKPQLSLSADRADFGFVSMGGTVTKTLTLRNSGQDDATFSMAPCFTDTFMITPAKGCVPASESLTFEIAVTREKSGSFDVPVTISVCGGNSLQFSVAGYAELPNVEFVCEAVDFGKVFHGSSGVASASLRNIGGITAVVFLNFAKQGQFYIEYAKDLPRAVSVSVVSEMSKGGMWECLSDVSFELSGISSTASMATLNAEQPGMIYRVELDKGASFQFNMRYHATELGKTVFKFPITLMNVPDFENRKHPIVSLEVVHAPLFPSDLHVDFHVATVIDPLNPNYNPITKTILVKNGSTDLVSYRIENKSAAFAVENATGRIGLTGFATVFIQFKPTEPKPYLDTLVLYVITEIGETVASEIEVSGVGTTRRLFPSTNHIVLPIAPIGIRTESTFHLINAGAIPGDVSVTLPLNEKQFPLEIEFPEGSHLNCNTETLPVRVSLLAAKPMNLTTRAAIIDKDGNSVPFLITAITDNSAFTLYSFLSLNDYRLTAGQGRPITAKLQKEHLVADVLAKFLKINDFGEIKPNEFKSTVSEMFKDFIERFLNSGVLKQPISSFPRDFVNSDGKILYEVITCLSGKNVQPRGSREREPKGLRRYEAKYNAMKALIQMLQAAGAMVASIKPEFLLGRQDFRDYMTERSKKQLLGLDYIGAPELASIFDEGELSAYTDRQHFEQMVQTRVELVVKVYPAISLESWTTVVLQVIKLYMFSRNEVDVSKSPGVDDALKFVKSVTDDLMFAEINRNRKSIETSNVFMPAECAVLKWATIHNCKMNNGSGLPIIDFVQFRNPVLLAGLFQSHMANYNIPIVSNPVTQEEKQHNADLIVEMFCKIHAPVIPTVHDLVSGDHVMMLILADQLMKSLPYFIPSTKLEFVTSLSERSQQVITLSNPANREITYTVILEGSSNFSLPSDTLTIGPGRSADLVIEYFGRRRCSEKGTLTLIPKQQNVMEPAPPASQLTNSPARQNSDSRRPTTAPSARGKKNGTSPKEVNSRTVSSSMVIELVSNVVVTEPYKSVRANGVLYERTPMSITIDNMARVPGRFTMIPRIFLVDNDSVDDAKLRERQVASLFEDSDNDVVDNVDPFRTLCDAYCPFIFGDDTVEFESENSKVTVNLEFAPISLRKVRLLLLLVNDQIGEIVYEIIGQSKVMPATPCPLKLRIEGGHAADGTLTLETKNAALMRSLGYARAKMESMGTGVTEAKFAELVLQHAHACSVIFNQGFTSTTFAVSVSAPKYFRVAKEITVEKVTTRSPPNILPISFKPTEPGNYPCTIALATDYDIRIFSFTGEALPATRRMALSMVTISGQEVAQDLPLDNPSGDTWQFKVSAEGDPRFEIESAFAMTPRSSRSLRISFACGKIGTYSTVVTIRNMTKGATLVYDVNTIVEDPPAIEEIKILCKARKNYTQFIPVEKYLGDGVIDIVSTLAIATHTNELQIECGKPREPFELTVYAPRSGMSMGTITFTNRETDMYIWFIVRVEVERPDPEEVIDVLTTSRKTSTISISVRNDRDTPTTFEVDFESTELFGDKFLTIEPRQTAIYALVFSPLRVKRKVVFVSFFNEDDGEFIYQLNLDVDPSDVHALAQLTTMIGSIATAQIILENPLARDATFKVTNENPGCFHVVSRPIISLGPREKKRIELRYIPSSFGACQTSLISFTSRVAGDVYYRASGVGRPPAPCSPVIVESMLRLKQSSSIVFHNPFTCKTNFDVRLIVPKASIFELLSRRTFSLSELGETHEIAFSFAPVEQTCYTATVVISTCGMENEIVWNYPIIGNTLVGDSSRIPPLKGRSGTVIFHKMVLSLIGERESFDTSQYKAYMSMDSGDEWMRSLVISSLDITGTGDSRVVQVTIKFQARKPVKKRVTLVVENPIHQKWRFNFDVAVERGHVSRIVTIESELNISAPRRICIGESISQPTPYIARFETGAPSELSVVPSSGIINVGLGSDNEFPFDIIFRPRMYGKMMVGLLIIETSDAEYLIEVRGRIPDWKPPDIPRISTIDTSIPDGARGKPRARRNFLKENIESAGNPTKRRMKVTRLRRV